jgi:hypothetical protein
MGLFRASSGRNQAKSAKRREKREKANKIRRFFGKAVLQKFHKCAAAIRALDCRNALPPNKLNRRLINRTSASVKKP